MGNRADDKSFLKDGSTSFGGGVDNDTPADELDRDQIAFGSNITCRRGRIKPRNPWKKIPLTFSSGCQDAFQTGFFQTAFPYKGGTTDALMSSQGGRQFKIDIDTPPGVLTTTTANFTIPAVNATVSVTVADTTNLFSQNPVVTIGRYGLAVVSIDSPTTLTVKNTRADNVGVVVGSGANVQFLATWSVTEVTPVLSKTTQTTAQFVIPAVGATVNVSVLDATGMVSQLPVIDIDGFTLVLVSVNSPVSITVKNLEAGEVGQVVPNGSVVSFSVFDANNPNTPLNWSEQAENYWILQDNASYPVIFDGAKSVRSLEKLNQVPIGNVMCYAFGRLSVALPDKSTYRVGDIVFGNSGTAQHNYRDAILYFTENNFLNEGGDFVARVYGAPSNSGDILAMKAASMTNTQLGQGPMLVGTPNIFFSVNLPFDRTTWKNLANALQTANPLVGPSNQDGTILVNDDVWYRSIDGIRTYKLAQRQFNSEPGNTPQSSEVGGLLNADTKEWLVYGSAALFDNRGMWTLSPQWSPHGYYHRGLIVIDFNLQSKIRKKFPPAWEGIWTGIRVLKIVKLVVKGADRCFMYVLNDSNQIELWEMVTSGTEDNDGISTDPISWEFHTCAFNCGDSDRFKRLMAQRMILNDVRGQVNLTVQYRADNGACWNDWWTGTVCAKKEDCAPSGCVPKIYKAQSRYPIRLPEPPDVFDPISKVLTRTGYEFQVRVAGVGHCSVDELRIYCLDEPENLGIEVVTQT